MCAGQLVWHSRRVRGRECCTSAASRAAVLRGLGGALGMPGRIRNAPCARGRLRRVWARLLSLSAYLGTSSDVARLDVSSALLLPGRSAVVGCHRPASASSERATSITSPIVGYVVIRLMSPYAQHHHRSAFSSKRSLGSLLAPQRQPLAARGTTPYRRAASRHTVLRMRRYTAKI